MVYTNLSALYTYPICALKHVRWFWDTPLVLNEFPGVSWQSAQQFDSFHNFHIAKEWLKTWLKLVKI